MSHYGNDVPFEVPQGWVWCRLGDIAYVAAGSTPPKESFVEHGIPYIKMYNLRNQKIDFNFHPQYIDYKTHTESLRRSMTQVGDIIMNIVGPPLGKLAIVPNELPEANFNQAAVLIRPLLHKNTLNKYIFRYLEQMSEINSISTKGSAGQVNISLTQSQNIRIPLPPLNEQKRIAKEIDQCFALVDTLEQNELTLKVTIQKAKSKILDLALSGKLTSDTPHYGKNEWKSVKISDICTTINGLWTGKKEPLVKVGVIRNANFTKNFNLDYSKIALIDVEVSSFSKRNLMAGDLIVEKSGGSDKYPVGRAILYEGPNNKYSFSNFTMVLRPKEANIINSRYLYYFLMSRYLQGVMRTMQTQTTGLHNLILDKFMSQTVVLPPIEKQVHIVENISHYFTILNSISSSC